MARLWLIALIPAAVTAFEHATPNEQGIHPETLTIISETVDNQRIYRGCLLFDSDWQCYRIDPAAVEVCTFTDNQITCTSPMQSDTLQILEDVIDGAE